MTVISPARDFQTDIRTFAIDLTVERQGVGRFSHYTAKFKTLFVERCDGECYLHFSPGNDAERINLRNVRRIVLPRTCEHFWISNPAMANAPNATGVIFYTSMDALIEPADIRTTPEDTVTVDNLAVTAVASTLPTYPCEWFTLFNLDKIEDLFFAVDSVASIGHPIVVGGSHLDIFVNDTGRVSVIGSGALTCAITVHR